MKKMEIPYKNDHGNEWQLLGKLNLPIDADANTAIVPWLTELLSPLSLSTDFQNSIQESVQASVMRALHPLTAPTSGNINLTIFALYENSLERKTWGFFHIERIENQRKVVETHTHAIDFYLYVEGH